VGTPPRWPKGTHVNSTENTAGKENTAKENTVFGRGGRLRALTNRWPTALALVMALGTFNTAESDEDVATLGGILLILPLLYLVVAKLRKRAASWPLLAVGIALVFLLKGLDLIPPETLFTAMALIVLVWAAMDGQLGRDGEFRIQALGMLGFGALALAGLMVDPDLGRYLVAAGWLFHGVWDFVHLKRDKVVSRSYAEWCGVVDIVVAVELTAGLWLP
jgi:hypothetical protein